MMQAPEGPVEAGVEYCRRVLGVDVAVKGVLRVEHRLSSSRYTRFKYVLYAEPECHNPRGEP
jgi:hypothetical protein